jgi:hypothetical protein
LPIGERRLPIESIDDWAIAIDRLAIELANVDSIDDRQLARQSPIDNPIGNRQCALNRQSAIVSRQWSR